MPSDAPLTEVSQVLQRMACNDLSQQAAENFPGIFGELACSANQAQDRVRNAVRIVKNIATGEISRKTWKY